MACMSHQCFTRIVKGDAVSYCHETWFDNSRYGTCPKCNSDENVHSSYDEAGDDDYDDDDD